MERPMLFNTEMVQAILDGRKTQTRRLVKTTDGIPLHSYSDVAAKRFLSYRVSCNVKNPPCENGDILWVRETWHKDVGRYMYQANYSNDEKFYRNGREVTLRWHPSIHMPREAARIFLRVKDVRVERLQEITEEQAVKEGCAAGRIEITCGPWGVEDDPDEWTAVEDFRRAWNDTIKIADFDKYGWDANPWVWVIEFERCEKPR